LREANLDRAYLRDVKNLERAFNLGHAHFLETRVGEKEQRIIEEVLKKRKLFVIVE